MSGLSKGAGAGVVATLRDTTPAARALVAGVFVNKLGAFIQVFLVLFLTARGFSGVQAGLALGGYGAGSVLGVLAGGALTDRLGPRRTILASMARSAALILAILYLPRHPGLPPAGPLVRAGGPAVPPGRGRPAGAVDPAPHAGAGRAGD